MEIQRQLAPSADQPSVDSRRQPRFPLEVDITIHSRTCGAVTGRTVDISESGISALLLMEVPIGELIELVFALPLGSVKIYATVRQRNAFRYGFEFVGLDGENGVIPATCRELAIAKACASHPRD